MYARDCDATGAQANCLAGKSIDENASRLLPEVARACCFQPSCPRKNCAPTITVLRQSARENASGANFDDFRSWPIVLQKSKVAGLKIFRENTTQRATADSYDLNR